MDFSPSDLRTKSLFKRCVVCPPVITQQCPSCKADETCTLMAAECSKCAYYDCIKTSDSGSIESKATPHSKSPSAAIAGGVIGGIVLIAVAVFLIWKIALKGRRRDPVEEWDPMDYPMEKPGTSALNTPRDARSRASTHTVGSMASTVLTRASNVIQIAYIPGVTNRNGNASSPDILAPPVPPIPIPTTPSQFADSPHEQHFFLPGDLRGSTYTDMSSLNGGRQSIAPSLARASIASTIYRDNAIPASVTKLKPSIISVGSNGSTVSSPNPSTRTPPIPNLNAKKFGQNGGASVRPVMIKIPSANDSSKGSPASSFSGMKPTALTITRIGSKSSSPADNGNAKQKPIGLGLRSSHVKSIAESHLTVESLHARGKDEVDNDSSEDEDDTDAHERSRQSLLGKNQSPFTDEAAADSPTIQRKNSKDAKSGKGKSPFEDENAL